MRKIVMYTWFIFVNILKQIHMNELLSMLKIVMYTWFILVDVVKSICMNELRTQHMNLEVHEHDTSMGWLRLVDSLKW